MLSHDNRCESIANVERKQTDISYQSPVIDFNS